MRMRPLWIVGSVLLSGCLIAGLAVLAQPPAASLAASAAGIDRGYITPDAVLAVVAHPRRVLTPPEMEFLPLEIILAAGLKELGLDPVQLEEVLAIVVLKDIRHRPRRRAWCSASPSRSARAVCCPSWSAARLARN